MNIILECAGIQGILSCPRPSLKSINIGNYPEAFAHEKIGPLLIDLQIGCITQSIGNDLYRDLWREIEILKTEYFKSLLSD